MKTVSSWDHLRIFGINVLTGESCSLMYRLLCDITEDGKRVIEKCLGCELKPPENWNSGAIGSIMLCPEMLIPIAVFALLEAGCREVWVTDCAAIGVDPDDNEDDVEHMKRVHKPVRRFAYLCPCQVTGGGFFPCSRLTAEPRDRPVELCI